MGARYASPSAATPPEDFIRELNKNKNAKAFFETLNRRNTYPDHVQATEREEARDEGTAYARDTRNAGER